VLLLIVFKALKEDRNEPNILTRIAEEHARRGIPAELYDDFGEVLARLASEKDPQSEGELRRAWASVIRPGLDYMKLKTGELDRARYRR
jgi:hypothetical protein